MGVGSAASTWPVRSAGSSDRRWCVVDADTQSYFDTIGHELLMRLLQRRIDDRWVITRLIHCT